MGTIHAQLESDACSDSRQSTFKEGMFSFIHSYNANFDGAVVSSIWSKPP